MAPTGGGVGKAAQELVQEMQKAQAELQKVEQTQKPEAAQGFQNVMQAQQTQGVQAPQQVQAANEATRVLVTAKINATKASTRVGEAARTEQSRMLKVFDGIIQGQVKMQGIINMALSGKQFSPPELIVMQASVYRFSQELELTSKVVEKATSGIKQTMNTQV